MARRLLSPLFLLTELCRAIAIVALADLAVRSAILLDPFGYDSFWYHLPFAAARAGVPISYDMSDTVRAQFNAFPPLPELLQGLLWKVSGSVNATGTVNFIAFGAFLIYAHRVFRAPFWLVGLISLTAPMVLIHTTVDYVDLFSNAFVAIGVSSCLFAYLFPQNRSRLLVIGALAALTIAAWSKYTMVPLVVVLFIVLTVMVMRSPATYRLSRHQAAVVILVFAAVSAAPYAKNLVVYGNPMWPIRVPIVGTSFPYLADPAGSGTELDRPPQLRGAPQALVFVESLFETQNPLRYDDRPRWALDQFRPMTASHRMGGFWGLGVAVYLAVTVGLLVSYRRRAGFIASLAFLGLLGFVAILPQSNELRYFQFIPLSWAAAIGMLYPQFRAAHPQATSGLLSLVLILFGYIVSENLVYFYVTAQDNRAAAILWGADKWWPLLEPGKKYCIVRHGAGGRVSHDRTHPHGALDRGPERRVPLSGWYDRRDAATSLAPGNRLVTAEPPRLPQNLPMRHPGERAARRLFPDAVCRWGIVRTMAGVGKSYG